VHPISPVVLVDTLFLRSFFTLGSFFGTLVSLTVRFLRGTFISISIGVSIRLLLSEVLLLGGVLVQLLILIMVTEVIILRFTLGKHISGIFQ